MGWRGVEDRGGGGGCSEARSNNILVFENREHTASVDAVSCREAWKEPPLKFTRAKYLKIMKDREGSW